MARGAPERIRSDNGPGFAAAAVRAWLARLGAGTPFIEPGSPREDGYRGSFNVEWRKVPEVPSHILPKRQERRD